MDAREQQDNRILKQQRSHAFGLKPNAKGELNPKRLVYYTEGSICQLRPENNVEYANRKGIKDVAITKFRSSKIGSKKKSMTRENLDLGNQQDANEFITKSR
jgi:hypothetical protein